METISHSITINAPQKKVWETLIGEKTYTQWTKQFHEGSYFKGAWQKGSDIHFLAKNDKGEEEGMYSRIKENQPQHFISIEHLGIIKNGKPDTTSEEAKKWAPTYENYTLNEKDGKTEFVMEMQIESSYKDMFNEMWPKALQDLKKISENQ